MRRSGIVLSLALSVLSSGSAARENGGPERATLQSDTATCGDMGYANKNQIDARPLTVQAVIGIMELGGHPLEDVCVGVFTLADHRLIKAVQTGADGRFSIAVEDGDYRLVATSTNLAPANEGIHVRSRSKTPELVGRLQAPGIDVVGYFSLKGKK